MSFFLHLMLNSLRLLSHKFDNAGEIILAIDDKEYWRRDIFPDYKGQRKADRAKSDINFDEFYEGLNEFTLELEKYFPYTVLQVPKCEADDIMGVLSKFYGRIERVVNVSSDKDIRQVIVDGAELYDPIKTEFVKLTVEDVKEYKIYHTLKGDAGDNIRNVWYGTRFTDTFLRYLKISGIYIETPYEFNKLSISEKLYAEYDTYKKNRKGETLPEKDIFKTVGFGDVGIGKAMNNLNEFFKEDKLLKSRYEENKKLVLFEEIPQDIQNNIISTYRDIEPQYDPTEIFNFLVRYNLKKLLLDITDFYIVEQKEKSTLDEWF